MKDNGEERTDILVLVDEEGNEHDFAMVDRFPVDLKEYAILVPVIYVEKDEQNAEIDFEDDAYIFRIEMAEGEEMLVEVDDDTEWDVVAAVWGERVEMNEMEDEEDPF
ncbi:MAG: DUF1292 domain-containing protein [Bacillota bacterium]|nr:DUF1292 domain-containing protein [Bacillota bacterium]